MTVTVGIRVVSLFAGVGGFDLAAQQAGMTTLATAEIDKHARAVLARRFPEAHHYDDVRKVSRDGLLRDVGAVPDVVLGGFPCQDLSVAGRRAGLAGERSGLFYEGLRVAEECGARWVVLENVPGLLSSNRGRDMGAVLGALADSGYGVAYRVLDAQYFGVAQRRRRVFIVGCLGDDGSASAEVLALAEGSLGHPAPSRPPRTVAAAAARPGTDRAGSTRDVANAVTSSMRFDADDNTAQGGHLVVQNAFGEPARTITTSQGRLAEAHDNFIVTSPVVTYRKSKRAQTVDDDETWVTDDKTNTINLFDTGDVRATSLVVDHPLAFMWQAGGNNSASGAYEYGMTPTMPASQQDGSVVRRLTPTECERLQGFPDGWTDGQADSHRYRQMGNAVAVPCVRWVLDRLVAVDTQKRAAA